MSKWYVINVRSGYESKVKSAIEQELTKKDLAEHVEEFFIPSEQITRVTRGKKIKVEKRFYPGYIFVKSNLTESVWNIIKNVTKSTAKYGDLLRGSGAPLVVPEREIEAVRSQLAKGVSISDLEVRFDVAESVRIIDGAFKSFIGVVEEIDAAKQKLKVTVSIFGRSTPVELGYGQVQKL